MTVNADAAECASITFESQNAINSLLTFAGAYTLTVSGDVVFTEPGASRNQTIGIGTGTLTCVNFSLFNTSAGTRDNFVTIGTGTLTVSGTLHMPGTAARNELTCSGASIINIGGDFTGTGTFTASSSTVVAGAVLDLQGFTLGTAEALTLNGTGITSLGALRNSSATTSADYSGLITLGSSSSIVSTTATISLNITNPGTITGSGFDLTLGGAGNGSLASVIGIGSGTLTKIGAGSWTISGTNTFTGGTTLSAGTLNINNAQALGTSAGTFTIISGTIDNTTGGSITTVNYPQVWNDDFIFTGTQNLNLGTGAVTLGASVVLTVNANTLTAGGIISGSTFNLTKAGIGTLSFGSNDVTITDLIISAGTLISTSGTLSVGDDYTNNGGTFTHNNGTVTFIGSTAQVITGTVVTAFNNLTVNNNTATGVSLNAIDVIINGTLDVPSGATFTLAANQLLGSLTTLSGTGTITTTNTSLTPIPTDKTWTPGVNYLLSGDQTVSQGAYTNLTLSGSGIKTAGGILTVDGILNVAAGITLTMTTNQLLGSLTSITGTGIITTENNSIAPIPAEKTWTQIVNYMRAGDQTVSSGAYDDLTLSGTGIKTASSDITVTGVLAVNNGVTLAMATNQLLGNLSSTLGTGTITTQNTSTTPLPSGETWAPAVIYTGSDQTVRLSSMFTTGTSALKGFDSTGDFEINLRLSL